VRRASIMRLVHRCFALSGLADLWFVNPGRCPGLVCCCPFRAKMFAFEGQRFLTLKPVVSQPGKDQWLLEFDERNKP